MQNGKYLEYSGKVGSFGTNYLFQYKNCKTRTLVRVP